MSRVRSIQTDEGVFWFDVQKNSQPATADQLELLAAAEEIEIEDLIDGMSFGSELTQGDVIHRLRVAYDAYPIPPEVIERRQARREHSSHEPKCRKCGAVGNSTRHHFVNRWILKELVGYQRHWSSRAKNCIPLCIECHRDIHSRSKGVHSIVKYLTDDECRFVDSALHALSRERPNLLILIARGEEEVYEVRLIRDWLEGKFNV